jgi:hypothetical protein
MEPVPRYISILIMGLEAWGFYHYSSLAVAKRGSRIPLSLYPEKLLSLGVIPATWLSIESEGRRAYPSQSAYPLFLARKVYALSTLVAMAISLIDGFGDPLCLRPITYTMAYKISGSVHTLIGSGMTIYYCKEMGVEKRKEKIALISITLLSALETCVAINSSDYLFPRAILGMGITAYGCLYRWQHDFNK